MGNIYQPISQVMTEIQWSISNSFVGCDLKLIKPEEAHMKFVQKIEAKSDQ